MTMMDPRKIDGRMRERITLLRRVRGVSAGGEKLIRLHDCWRDGDYIEIFMAPWFFGQGTSDFEYAESLRVLTIAHRPGDICRAKCVDSTKVAARLPGSLNWAPILPPGWEFLIIFDREDRQAATMWMTARWREDRLSGGVDVLSIHAWREVEE